MAARAQTQPEEAEEGRNKQLQVQAQTVAQTVALCGLALCTGTGTGVVVLRLARIAAAGARGHGNCEDGVGAGQATCRSYRLELISDSKPDLGTNQRGNQRPPGHKHHLFDLGNIQRRSLHRILRPHEAPEDATIITSLQHPEPLLLFFLSVFFLLSFAFTRYQSEYSECPVSRR